MKSKLNPNWAFGMGLPVTTLSSFKLIFPSGTPVSNPFSSLPLTSLYLASPTCGLSPCIVKLSGRAKISAGV